MRGNTKSSNATHLFLRALGVPWCPGVSRPGVTAPGVAWPGVDSHILVLAPGVAPGVWAALALPGVSSHLGCMDRNRNC